LAVALTDFQKAQCFFMLAINIAAQVVIRKGGLQPQSLQQIYDTYIFIKVLAISGFLPITFTLFTLHLIGMVSWYLMALSFLSVALSIVTLLTIGEFNPSQADMIDLASSYATGGPSSCGNAQPAAFCYSPVGYYYGPSLDTFSIGDVAFRMLGFCLVVFLLLVVGKSRVLQWPMAQRFTRWLADKLTPCLAFFPSISSCARKLSRYPVVKRFTHWMMEKGAFCLSILVHFADTVRWRVATQPTLHRSSVSLSRRMAPWKQSDRYVMGKRFVVRSCNEFWSNTARFFRSTTCTKATRKCIIIATYLTMSGLYIYWFIIFAQDLAYFAINGNYSKTWNFGQIVAITVWAPPLCEYIHLELRK